MIQLDHNATTRPTPEVVEGVARALTDTWHNPSSVHRAGQAARQAVELARQQVAELLNASAREVTFTSGGTESINLAVRGALGSTGKRVVVTSEVEHSAVRDLVEDLERRDECEVRWAPLLEHGIVDADALDDLVTPDVALVSVQWANNETGAIQPVERIARLCEAKNVLFHTDATQWVGKMPTDVTDAPIDLLTCSAHKMHGPKGVGVLWARRGVRLRPLQPGSHELGRRGGTENVPGIVGMGVSAQQAKAWLDDPDARARIGALRDRLEAGILERVPDAVVNGRDVDRLWNTTNVGFPAMEAEALLLLLSERGVCASAGAACSSGSLEPSPVLLAMGVPERVAHGSIRLSLGRETTEGEIDDAAGIIVSAVERLRVTSG